MGKRKKPSKKVPAPDQEETAPSPATAPSLPGPEEAREPSVPPRMRTARLIALLLAVFAGATCASYFLLVAASKKHADPRPAETAAAPPRASPPPAAAPAPTPAPAPVAAAPAPASTPEPPPAPAPPATPAPEPQPAPAPPIPAAEPRGPSFALVNANLLFARHPKTKAAEDQINAERDAATRGLSFLTTEADRLESEIRKLTGTAKDARFREWQAKADEIRKFHSDHERKLSEKALKAREDVVAEVRKAVAAEASMAEANLVFDSSGHGLNSIPFLLYSREGLNFTRPVLTALSGDIVGTPEPPNAAPAGLRIAGVDYAKVFANADRAKAAEGRIKADRENAERVLKEKLAGFRQLAAEPGRASADEVNEADKGLRQWFASRDRELQELALRLRNEVVAEINRIIAEIARKADADLVLDRSSKGLNGVPLLFYSAPMADWTDVAIEVINGRLAVKNAGAPVASTTAMRFGVLDSAALFQSLPAAREVEAAVDAEVLKRRDEEARSAEKAIQELRTKGYGEILAKMKTTIADEARRAGVDVIFDVGAKTLNGLPVVLLARGVPDVTARMIKATGGVAASP